MELTIIIILSLAILYIVLTIFRESYQNKWFNRGYISAASKYDKSEYRSYSDHEDESNKIFHDKYGFHYD